MNENEDYEEYQESDYDPSKPAFWQNPPLILKCIAYIILITGTLTACFLFYLMFKELYVDYSALKLSVLTLIGSIFSWAFILTFAQIAQNIEKIANKE